MSQTQLDNHMEKVMINAWLNNHQVTICKPSYGIHTETQCTVKSFKGE